MNGKKVFLGMVVLLIIVFAVTGCGGTKQVQPNNVPTKNAPINNTPTNTISNNSGKTFTVDQLKTFNGQNGNPAYIAIDGNVYDVTNQPSWKNGKHKGFSAGQDVTKAIDSSEHGRSVLGGLSVIGTLVK